HERDVLSANNQLKKISNDVEIASAINFSKLISRCVTSIMESVHINMGVWAIYKAVNRSDLNHHRMLKMNGKCIDLSILCSKKVW
ncbi:hypothetical protein QT621_24920, partial [Xanthomonas citri pv. citri]